MSQPWSNGFDWDQRSEDFVYGYVLGKGNYSVYIQGWDAYFDEWNQQWVYHKETNRND